jgi:hypothetical protein
MAVYHFEGIVGRWRPRCIIRARLILSLIYTTWYKEITDAYHQQYEGITFREKNGSVVSSDRSKSNKK